MLWRSFEIAFTSHSYSECWNGKRTGYYSRMIFTGILYILCEQSPGRNFMLSHTVFPLTLTHLAREFAQIYSLERKKCNNCPFFSSCIPIMGVFLEKRNDKTYKGSPTFHSLMPIRTEEVECGAGGDGAKVGNDSSIFRITLHHNKKADKFPQIRTAVHKFIHSSSKERKEKIWIWLWHPAHHTAILKPYYE